MKAIRYTTISALILSSVMVAGCATMAPPAVVVAEDVRVAFPAPPATLMQAPRPLKPLPPGAALDDVLRVVIENYGQHALNAEQLRALQEWVDQQYQIHRQ